MPHPQVAVSCRLPGRLAMFLVSLGCVLLMGGPSAFAGVRHRQVHHRHRSVARHRSYRVLRRELRTCQKRHPGHCRGQRTAVRRAAAHRSHRRFRQATRHSAGRRPRLVWHAVDIGGVPRLTVNHDVLSWNDTDPHNAYVFVEKVPGRPDSYRDVTGTSLIPRPVAGKVVSYSVRSASGGGWADEVSIGYPVTGPGPHAWAAGIDPFTVGLVAGSGLNSQIGYLQLVGAHTARLEFGIDTPLSQIAPIVASYADSGIRPLLLASFDDRLPTPAEAANLATWAAALGPGGTYWNAQNNPGNDAVTDIEFGNETSYSYQFSNNSPSVYAARARTYALRVRTAVDAIRNANPKVGLLAIADNAQQGDTWVTQMFRAVPNLSSLVAGWTVHPYGPTWATRVRNTIASTAAAGGSARVPVWVTEFGLATDNGRCLSDNYGFSPCMTYAAAAQTLQSVLTGMRTTFGGRIAAVYLFQASDQQRTGTSSNRESYFGALQTDGSPKGSYTAAVEADLAGLVR
jgi:Glycosyl hydrolase catalytic core